MLNLTNEEIALVYVTLAHNKLSTRKSLSNQKKKIDALEALITLTKDDPSTIIVGDTNVSELRELLAQKKKELDSTTGYHGVLNGLLTKVEPIVSPMQGTPEFENLIEEADLGSVVADLKEGGML